VSIVWDWSDPMLECTNHDFANGTCAISGDKLELPFMYWVGAQIITINAKSIGGGFVLDVVMSNYIGEHISDRRSLGKVHQMFVSRIKGGEFGC